MAYFRKFFHFGLKAKYKYMLMFFGLAFVLAFCFFEMTCQATTEELSSVVSPSGSFSANINSSGVIVESETTHLNYYSILKNHRYIFTNNSPSAKPIAFSDKIPEISDTVTTSVIDAHSSYEFVADHDYFLAVDFGANTVFTLIDYGTTLDFARFYKCTYFFFST